jgi:hypothetical protein
MLDQGLVKGMVYDVTTGEGVPHAQVHLEYAGQDMFSDVTDDMSKYKIHAPSAAYEATATAEGYCPASESAWYPQPDRTIERNLVLSPILSAGQVRVHLTTRDSLKLSTYGPGGCVIDSAGSSCGEDGVEAVAQMWTDKGQTVTFTHLADGVYRVYATSEEPLAGKTAKVRVYTEGCSNEAMRRYKLEAGDGESGEGVGETFVPAAAAAAVVTRRGAKLGGTKSQMLADVDALQRLKKRMIAAKALASGRHLLAAEDGPHFDDETGEPYVPPHRAERAGHTWFVTCFTSEGGHIAFHTAAECPATMTTPPAEDAGAGMGAEVAVEGRMIDSQTGTGVEGVFVQLIFAGENVAETTTDAQGAYSMMAVPSPYQLVASKAGYMTSNTDLSVSESGVGEGGRIMMSKELEPGELRMVLSWQDPENRIDLDWHIVTPLVQVN